MFCDNRFFNQQLYKTQKLVYSNHIQASTHPPVQKLVIAHITSRRSSNATVVSRMWKQDLCADDLFPESPKAATDLKYVGAKT